jgi:transcription elongation factor Elf1
LNRYKLDSIGNEVYINDQYRIDKTNNCDYEVNSLINNSECNVSVRLYGSYIHLKIKRDNSKYDYNCLICRWSTTMELYALIKKLDPINIYNGFIVLHNNK